MPNIEYELNEKIHAIIINPYLTWEDFCANCDLIKKYNIKNISTSLNYLDDFKNRLSNYSANINALISYPLADLPVTFIEELVNFAKDKGANGIEYIPNFINLSKRNLENFQKKLVDPINQGQLKWNKNSTIIILSILLITTSLALIQVTLPLDLVKGGVYRNALSKEIISLIISIQLILLLFLQWPVGSWISKKERLFGLKFSLINFTFASFLLFISSYLNIPAFYLISLALILVSLGTASFLPTSTDVVFRIAPSNKKGFALALLSQCFAMGYFFGPFISGRILDLFGYASIIWLSISCCCFVVFTILFRRLF